MAGASRERGNYLIKGGAVITVDRSLGTLPKADVIVREAGGCVTTRTGSALRYNTRDAIQPSVVCANPALHAALIARLRDGEPLHA